MADAAVEASEAGGVRPGLPNPVATPLRVLWVGGVLSTLAGEASAQQTVAVVGQALALAGLVGGAVAGSFAAYRRAPRKAFWPAFGIYLGLLAVLASTRAGDLSIVPLALVLGGAAGLLPFAASYFAIRWCWSRIRGRAEP